MIRSYYTVEYKDKNGWKLGAWRVEYGRRKARVLEAAYKTAGFETKMRKETF